MSELRPEAAPPSLDPSPSTELSRRSILRAGALAGGGIIAATLAACAPATGAATWTYGPKGVPAAAAPSPAAPSSSPAASDGHAAHSAEPAASSSPSAAPSAHADHDAAALAVVQRFLDGE